MLYEQDFRASTAQARAFSYECGGVLAIDLPQSRNDVRALQTVRGEEIVSEYFDAVYGDESRNVHHNMTPTQRIPVIRQNPLQPRRALSLMGQIPSRAKVISGTPLINARRESGAKMTPFCDPFKLADA